MLIPPKKTKEQIEQERNILREGFQSPFWKVLSNIIQTEMDANYKLLPGIATVDDLRRIQGQLQAFDRILGIADPFKSKT